MPVPSDLDIAQAAKIKPIAAIARELGLDEDDIELYGKYKAKVSLEVREKLKDRPQGKYIDVTAITPTPLGEGKTVTTIGLSMALNRIGKKTITCIRQQSLG
ncbi:MAG: formate--tetrahydrofolate ligase, partial [Chloroflexota bacterium]